MKADHNFDDFMREQSRKRIGLWRPKVYSAIPKSPMQFNGDRTPKEPDSGYPQAFDETSVFPEQI